jgi:ribosomal protein L15
MNLGTYLKKGIAKKKGEGTEVNLGEYKILGDGEVKNKLIIKAKEASKSAMDKVRKAGGSIELPSKNTEKKE